MCASKLNEIAGMRRNFEVECSKYPINAQKVLSDLIGSLRRYFGAENQDIKLFPPNHKDLSSTIEIEFSFWYSDPVSKSSKDNKCSIYQIPFTMKYLDGVYTLNILGKSFALNSDNKKLFQFIESYLIDNISKFAPYKSNDN